MRILNIIDVNFEVFKILKRENLGNSEILLYKNKKNEGMILIKFKNKAINYTKTNEIEKEYYRLKEFYSKKI